MRCALDERSLNPYLRAQAFRLNTPALLANTQGQSHEKEFRF